MERRGVLKLVGGAAGTAGAAVFGASTMGNEAEEPPRSDRTDEESSPEPSRNKEKEKLRREEMGHELVGVGAHDLLANDELGELQSWLERESDGAVSVEVLGESNEGREIHSARVGEGDVDVFAIAE